MKLASFRTGLHLTLNKTQYRIERMFTSGECFLERVSDHAIEKIDKAELMELLSSGVLVIHGGEYNKSQNNNRDRNTKVFLDLPEDERTNILRKKEYVSEAIRFLGNTPTKIMLDKIIERVSEKIEDRNTPSISTVLRWWKKWDVSENDLMSLADKKSGSSKSRKFKGIVENTFFEVVESVYFSLQKPTKQQVYEELCYKINDLNKIRLNALSIPSRAQFYKMFRKVDKYETLATREGKDIADKHFRSTGRGVATNYILERVEVDHTPLDVMVVNEKTGLAEGRPILTVLLDKHSRMPLGFEVSFDSTTESRVILALKNSIFPKTYIKNNYPDINYDWPAYGIPSTLICDNGLEFHANGLRAMCAELNIELQFCPKRQPNYKGAIERFLGTLNRAVCHRIPGTTRSNINQRGNYKSEKMASVTLAELKELIHEWIIDIYCHEINRTTQRIPYALWNEGLKIREPLLPESKHQLDLILSWEKTRKLSHEGIHLYGLQYNSSELTLLRKRSYENYDVKVRYNQENIESVWVYDELNDDYICVPCTQPDYVFGINLKQHLQIKKGKSIEGKLEQDLSTLMERKAAFSKHIQELSSSKKIRPRQKAARFNIKENDLTNLDNNKTKSVLSKLDKWNVTTIPRFDTSQKEEH
ncbi:MAG: DDE-type integrase/transposase/recombinase [Cellvibrio sp.]|nr:DDE-type integrase/transposase/recombinase [Cellvibrio sp.]